MKIKCIKILSFSFLLLLLCMIGMAEPNRILSGNDINLYIGNQEKLREYLKNVREAGCKDFRADFWWYLSDNNGQKTITEIVPLQKIAEEFSVNIIPSLYYLDMGGNTSSLPENSELFELFIEKSAANFSKYKTWFFSNRISSKNHSQKLSPAVYFRFLEKYSGIIKSKIPNSKIIADFSFPDNIDLLENLFRNNKTPFDIIALENVLKNDDQTEMLNNIADIKNVLNRYKKENIRIIISETKLSQMYINIEDADKIPSAMVKSVIAANASKITDKVFVPDYPDTSTCLLNAVNSVRYSIYAADPNMKRGIITNDPGKEILQQEKNNKAFAICSKFIENNKYLNDIYINDTVKMNLFKNSAGTLSAVIWSSDNDNKLIKIFTDQKLQMIDLVGNTGELSGSKSFIIYPSFSEPSYLSSLSDFYELYSTIETLPQNVFIYPGLEKQFEVTFKNTALKKIAGRIIISPDPALKIEPVTKEFSVESNSVFTEKIKIHPAPSITPGFYSGTIRMIIDDPELNEISANLSRKFIIRAERALKTKLDIKQSKPFPELRLDLLNVSDSKVDGVLNWILKSRSKQLERPETFAALLPNQSLHNLCSIKEGPNETKILVNASSGKDIISTGTLRICVQDYIQTLPIIDGKIGEWIPRDFISINQKSQVRKFPFNEEYNPDKFSSRIWTGWNNKNMFIAISVIDTFNNIPKANDNDKKYRFSFNITHSQDSILDETSTETVRIDLVSSGSLNLTTVTDEHRNSVNINPVIRRADTGSGCSIEMQIPLSKLNLSPDGHNIIGYNVVFERILNEGFNNNGIISMIWNENEYEINSGINSPGAAIISLRQTSK